MSDFAWYCFLYRDDFICQTLGKKFNTAANSIPHRQVMSLSTSETLAGFFLSMASYFSEAREPAQALLELKFKELILTIADNPGNAELLSYFCSLVHEPRPVALQRLMMDNFKFNLKLEEFARLSNRSLSAFKRDFQQVFQTTPGKWLLEKRLNHAKHLLGNTQTTIGDTAFESGFKTISHFSRAFKEKFGFPPSALRRNRNQTSPHV